MSGLVLLTPVCAFTHPLLPLLSKFDFKVIVVWTNTIVYEFTVVTSLDKQNGVVRILFAVQSQEQLVIDFVEDFWKVDSDKELGIF